MAYGRLCVCVCVVIPFILDVKFVDVPTGVTQEEGHTGFIFIHLPSAVLAQFFLIVLHLLGIFSFLCGEKSQFV